MLVTYYSSLIGWLPKQTVDTRSFIVAIPRYACFTSEHHEHYSIDFIDALVVLWKTLLASTTLDNIQMRMKNNLQVPSTSAGAVLELLRVLIQTSQHFANGLLQHHLLA